MGFLNWFFNKKQEKQQENKIQCPRCLGKGHVDNEDIKRLKKELFWAPGDCAYCEGIGSVTTNMINSVNVDEAYLTVDLSPEERMKFLLKDKAAVERSKEFESVIEYLRNSVIRLHKEENKNINEITEALLNEFGISINDQDTAQNLQEFIEIVITKYDKSEL